MAYIVMAYLVMAYIVMAYILIAYMVVAYMGMAYICYVVMATWENSHGLYSDDLCSNGLQLLSCRQRRRPNNNYGLQWLWPTIVMAYNSYGL